MRLENLDMSFFKYMCFFLVLGMFSSCGGSTSQGGNQPKDLNFDGVKTPENFSEMVLLSISSYRGIILADQFSTEKEVNKAELKRTVDLYAEAMRKGDWIRDDNEMKQDGNKFTKSYRWLDKRRRMAMTVKIIFSKRGDDISLDEVEFDTNLDILKKVTY